MGVDRLLADLRHAVRLWGRSPGFSTVALLTIGVGIGAATAIFGQILHILQILQILHAGTSAVLGIWALGLGSWSESYAYIPRIFVTVATREIATM